MLLSKAVRLGLVIALAFLLSSAVFGQGVNARLDGVVQDQSKGVIPGVEVSLTNKATNLTFESITGPRGRYVFVNVPGGVYVLAAELPGFKRYVQDNVILEVGQTPTINITLQTGEITEEVTVTTTTVKVDQVSQSVGQVVTGKQIVDLPLAGRDPMQLFYLTVGTSRDLGGRVDGLRSTTNNVQIEGISSMDPMLTGSATTSTAPVIPEALAEYKVVNSSAAAEDGSGGGAQVKLVYRSGTNEFHGSVWEFHRNRSLNANSFFLNRNGIDKPAFRRHQYGFAIGGPVIKDKGFFHVTYENQTQIQDSTRNANVYTQRFKDTGIFQYVDTGDGSIKEIDLTTVDPTRLGLNTQFSAFAASIPAPNNFDRGDGLNTGGFRYSADNPFDEWRLIVKGDYIITDAHRLGLSYAMQRQDDPGVTHIDGFRTVENFEDYPAGVITLTSSLTPKLLNELRLGGTSRLWEFTNGNPNRFTTIPLPHFSGISGDSNGTRGSSTDPNPSNFLPQQGPSVTTTVNDNISWIRGNHTFKGGIDFRWNQSNVAFGGDHYLPVAATHPGGNPATIPAIAGLSSSDATRAQNLTNDVTASLGRITWDYQQIAADGSAYVPFETKLRRWRSQEYSFFFQDTWKVRDNLTLQLGVRWEVFPSHYEGEGIFSYPVDSSGRGCVTCLFGISGPGETRLGLLPEAGKDLYDTDMNNFAPNIGFTWDPFGDGKWSVAANYRIAYDRNPLVNTLFQDFSQEGAAASFTLDGQPGQRLSDALDIMNANGVGTGGLLDPGVPFGPKAFNRNGTVTVWDEGYYTPYIQSWSFRLQHEIMRDTVLEVAYVGNHGAGLPRSPDINQLNITNQGFLEGFQAAQRNLAANGDPLVGEATGVFGQIWAACPQCGGQTGNIRRGEVASFANFIDRSLRGGPLAAAGLPDNFFRANPQFNAAWLLGNVSHSTYNGLKIDLRRRFSDGLQFAANYAFSKAISDYEGGQSQRNSFRDNNNRGLDKTLSGIDARHIINVNGIYELPFGRGRRWGSGSNAFVDAILGGWQINGIFSYNTGQRFTITSSGRNTLTIGDTSTANFSGNDQDFTSQVLHDGNTIRMISNDQKALFSNAVAGNAGGSAQRFFRGQDFWVIDGSIFKDFRVPWFGAEDAKVQFRMEMFNLPNSTVFNTGNSSINSSSFGIISSARDNRIMQVALKFIF